MSSDVRRLFQFAGQPEHPYHEVGAEENEAGAAERWPLLAAVDRLLAAAAADRSRRRRPRTTAANGSRRGGER